MTVKNPSFIPNILASGLNVYAGGSGISGRIEDANSFIQSVSIGSPGNFGAIVTSWVYKVNLAVSIVPLHLTNYIGFDRYVTERRWRVVQYKNRRSDYPAKLVSSRGEV